MNTEPVVLLPLRLETRYSADQSVLRVRIFPDDIHVEALDPGLTAEEGAAGEAYWHAVWAPDDGDPAAVDPWAELVRRVGPRRASWVAEALRPTNEAERPASPPVFPVVAGRTNAPPLVRTLPTRFHAFATHLGVVRTGESGPVRQPLHVGLPVQPGAAPQFVKGVPVVAEELRWLVDFEEAKAAGMGLEIGLAFPGQPVERLVVVGLREDLDPVTAADRVAALIRQHAYSDGASFVPQGAPTNNTDTDRSAWSRGAATPEPTQDAAPPVGSNAAVLARALDVPATTFAALENAGGTEQDAARAMSTALWATTWEVIFDKLTNPTTPGRSFTAFERDNLRDHAISHLRGRGPIPALRIGRQPYGILPATAFTPERYVPLRPGITDAGLSRFLHNARKLWAAGVDAVPTVMDGDLEQALPEILGSSPVMVGLRVRSLTQVNKCYQPLPFLLDAQDNCASQEGLDQIAREFLGFEPTEVGSTGLLGKDSSPLALVLTDESDLDYLDRLRAGAPPADEKSVLQALLGLAAAIEADQWDHTTGDEGIAKLHQALPVAAHLVDTGVVQRGLRTIAQAGPSPDGATLAGDAVTALRAAGVKRFDPGSVLAAYPIDAVRPAAFVTAATRRQDSLLNDPVRIVQLTDHVFSRYVRHSEFQAALEALRRVTSKEDRALLLGEVLDTASHRLDAWVTSLATSRLDRQRSAGIHGVGLGGYGFVEHIEPDAPVPDEPPEGLDLPAGDHVFANRRDGGFVHAPSLDHATTAGVLRSARLTHDAGDSGSPALDIDLSSGRVRTGLHILDGVRSGQPLGALLGYRLERWLHERSVNGLHLDRFVYVLRSLAPLRAAKLTDHQVEPVPVALESVAAANVVDGVRLVEIFATADGPARISGRLTQGPDQATMQRYGQHWNPPTPDEGVAVLQAIADLDSVHDAVADVLLAESVHQLVRGNPAGAAAALDAAGGGDQVPPEPEVVQTPRSGIAFTHRLVVLTPPVGPAGGSGWSDDAPRALAHPRLEAWARSELGPASRCVLAVEPRTTLADHELCALDVLLDAGPALRERIGGEPLAQRPAAWGRGTDRLVLGEIEDVARSLRSMLGTAHAAVPTNFAAPAELHAAGRRSAPPRAMDLVALQDRTRAARDGLNRSRVAVAEAATGNGDIATALRTLYRWGVRLPVPLATLPADGLVRVAEAVTRTVDQRLAGADAALVKAAAATSDEEQLGGLDEALVAVFGPGLPALPDLVLPAGTAEQLTAALAAPAGQPATGEVRQWLSRWASVRHGVGGYVETLLFRNALGAAVQHRVAQLPHDPVGRWVGSRFPDGAPLPTGPQVSLVLEVPSGPTPDPGNPLAALVVDEWTDVIPRRVRLPGREAGADEAYGPVAVTGAAVNAHTPSARPPQTILLAVTPDGQPWTVEKLRDVVDDTLRLAQQRAVTLERVPLAPRILPALYVNDWSLQGQSDRVLFASGLLRKFHQEIAIPKFVKG